MCVCWGGGRDGTGGHRGKWLCTGEGEERLGSKPLLPGLSSLPLVSPFPWLATRTNGPVPHWLAPNYSKYLEGEEVGFRLTQHTQ